MDDSINTQSSQGFHPHNLAYLRQHLVYWPGTDQLGRHILVLALCNLVSPTIISFDFLFDQLVSLLASIAHQEYVLVLFPPPPPAIEARSFQPSTFWLLWKMRGLEYRFKKNIKVVYVVGYAGWEFHATAAILLTITSPKFKRKIVYVPTLASLPTHHSTPIPNSHAVDQPTPPALTAALPLASLRIPPATLAYNHALDPTWLTSTLPPTAAAALLAAAAPTWHLPITSEFSTHPYLLPTPIPRAIAILARILANGRQTQGLFRRTVLKVDAVLVQSRLDARAHAGSEGQEQWPPDAEREWTQLTAGVTAPDQTLLIATSLLTRWVRDLPVAILDDVKLAKVLIRAHAPESWPPLVFPPTDPPHLKRSMAVISRVLVLVADASEANLMTGANLSRVWAPNVVRTADPMRDMQLAADTSSVVHVMIQEWCTRDGWERWFGEFREVVEQVVGC